MEELEHVLKEYNNILSSNGSRPFKKRKTGLDRVDLAKQIQHLFHFLDSSDEYVCLICLNSLSSLFENCPQQIHDTLLDACPLDSFVKKMYTFGSHSLKFCLCNCIVSYFRCLVENDSNILPLLDTVLKFLSTEKSSTGLSETYLLNMLSSCCKVVSSSDEADEFCHWITKNIVQLDDIFWNEKRENVLFSYYSFLGRIVKLILNDDDFNKNDLKEICYDPIRRMSDRVYNDFKINDKNGYIINKYLSISLNILKSNKGGISFLKLFLNVSCSLIVQYKECTFDLSAPTSLVDNDVKLQVRVVIIVVAYCIFESSKFGSVEGLDALYKQLTSIVHMFDVRLIHTKIFALFVLDDKHMLDLLQMSQNLYKVFTTYDSILNSNYISIDLIKQILDPHVMFEKFCCCISYDKQVFVDYLISKETATTLLVYMLDYFKFVCSHTNQFQCSLSKSEQENVSTLMSNVMSQVQKLKHVFPYNIDPLINRYNFTKQFFNKA
ncbi:STS1 [Acrasis kona]|uniref:STS1 n=1 Tax=Acrasis kona TaxID=1008807 RepID=A0AAW2YN66_9EUKA